MNKPLAVLAGFVVIVGALNTAGAWYTGTQLEGVLQTSIAQANQALAAQLKGSQTQGSIELVSLERHLYSSTARYRLKAQDQSAGPDAPPLELLFVDHIEHGPLPWSRIKAFKWMPVMATSNYALEKTPFSEKWFAAAKDQSPLQGQVTLGYNRSVSARMDILPLQVDLDQASNLSFSGMTMDIEADADAQNVKAKGYMDHLKLLAASLDKPPVLLELNGLTLASDLKKSPYGFYLGQNVLELSNGQMTFGEQQSVLDIKDFEYSGSASANGSLLSGRLAYNVASIGLDGRPVGSASMLLTGSSLDIPAMQSLLSTYQNKFQPQVDGTLPAVQLTPAEEKQMQADVEKLLAAKPQLALEKLALKTASGESHFSLALGLAQPSTFDLPPIAVIQQMVTALDAKLVLSKPMLADLAALQARLNGQTDPQLIAQQASMTSDMTSSMALGSGLATLEGNDILSSLKYAQGQVDFNGQKMSLDDFVSLLMTRFGGQGGEPLGSTQ